MFIVNLIKELMFSGMLTSLTVTFFIYGTLFLINSIYAFNDLHDRAFNPEKEKKYQYLIYGILFILAGLLLNPWGLNYLMRPMIHSFLPANIAIMICDKKFPSFSIKNNIIWVICYFLPVISGYYKNYFIFYIAYFTLYIFMRL